MPSSNVILYAGGGLVFILILWSKGYLGDRPMPAWPGPHAGGKTPSRDAFARAVKLAIDEAHDEIAATMADQFRTQVVTAHTATFTSAGPAPTPTPSPATPPAPPSP